MQSKSKLFIIVLLKLEMGMKSNRNGKVMNKIKTKRPKK